MNEFEQFEIYWDQAVNALAGRIAKEANPIMTQSRVQAIWREELLDKRFRSVTQKHGARTFLDDLERRDPDTACRVIRQLESSQMPISVDGKTVIGKACIAAVGLAAAGAEKIHAITRVASLAVGGTFAVKAAQDALQGTKSNLLEALEQECAIQLQRFKEIFEGKDA